MLLAWSVTAGASAQTLPSYPITFDEGRLTFGAEVSATVGPDDTGYFNFTGYDASTLRQVRASVTGSWRATDRVALLGELRAQTGLGVQPYGLYLRLTPWRSRRIDFQVGRIPPVFGAYARRSYGTDNPLIGVPLAYQYLTSLRADALPASADDLLRMRGRGWSSSFPIGSSEADAGLPIADALRWDTGAQVHVGAGQVDATIGVTNGSLSRPRVRDDNSGKQVTGRLEWRPVIGLVIGGSASRGAYVTRHALERLPRGVGSDAYVQKAAGADVEYSRDHWMWRAETLLSRWDVPRVAAPFVASPLGAVALMTEGRYTLFPGAYAAARVEHLTFSRVTGTARRTTWDAPVTRVEAGGGYHLQRNLLLKAVYQQNWRDGGRVRMRRLGAVQLLFWF